MKYLRLLNRTEDALPEPGTPAAQAMLREYIAAVQAMAEAGVLVDCAPLTAASAATTVRVRDGQPLLTDGADVFIELDGRLINASQDGQLGMGTVLAGALRRVEAGSEEPAERELIEEYERLRRDVQGVVGRNEVA